MTAEGPSGSPRDPVRFGIAAPLRHRDFRLLWTGLVASLLGDGVFLVAVAWQAYAIANRPSALAGVGLANSVPQVALLLLGGAVTDRFSRQTVLVAADLGRGAALAILASLAWTGSLELWHLYAAGAVLGAGAAFAAPALEAIVPQLVDEDQLQTANGLDQFLRPTMLRLIGPALGGLVLALVGSANAFAVDAASFAFSAWCVSRIRCAGLLDRDAAGERSESLWADLRVGIGYVRRQVWLWGTFVAATFTYLLFLGPMEVLVPYLVKNDLHGTAGTLGLVLGFGGLGSIGAAAVTGQRRHIRRPITFMYVAWTGATLLVAAFGLVTRQWQLAAVLFIIGALEAAGTVVWATLKQRLVPSGLLGRVSSIDLFVSTVLLPLSYLLTPLAATTLGVRTTFVLAGTLGAASTLGFLFVPGMRRHDHAFEPVAPAGATGEVGPGARPLVNV